jgi:hypothetical protein
MSAITAPHDAKQTAVTLLIALLDLGLAVALFLLMIRDS